MFNAELNRLSSLRKTCEVFIKKRSAFFPRSGNSNVRTASGVQNTQVLVIIVILSTTVLYIARSVLAYLERYKFTLPACTPLLCCTLRIFLYFAHRAGQMYTVPALTYVIYCGNVLLHKCFPFNNGWEEICYHVSLYSVFI